jgi:hypothetical protein
MNAQEKVLEGWDARPSVGARQEESLSLRWDQLRIDMPSHAGPSEHLPSPGNCPEPMPTAYPREKPKNRSSSRSMEHTKALRKSFSLAVCLIAIPMLFVLCVALLFLGAGTPQLWLPLILLLISVSYLGQVSSS